MLAIGGSEDNPRCRTSGRVTRPSVRSATRLSRGRTTRDSATPIVAAICCALDAVSGSQRAMTGGSSRGGTSTCFAPSASCAAKSAASAARRAGSAGSRCRGPGLDLGSPGRSKTPACGLPALLRRAESRRFSASIGCRSAADRTGRLRAHQPRRRRPRRPAADRPARSPTAKATGTSCAPSATTPPVVWAAPGGSQRIEPPAGSLNPDAPGPASR